MLRFFFHRYAFMVRLMELIGLAGIAANTWMAVAGKMELAQLILSGAIISEYIFLRLCALWRSQGIGLQFLKAMVPTSYILAIATWTFFMTKSSAILVTTLILLAIIIHVNIILLFLHLKDHPV